MPSKITFSVATLLLVAGALASASTLHTEGEQYLRRLSSKDIDPSSSIFRGNGAFVDGVETVYDDFSTAWRFLGFYTDCNICLDNDNDNDNGDEEFADPKDCLENGADTTVCRRYALWAAYVDEGYEGNGVSEYQYYDRQHHRWDKSACDEHQEKIGDDDVRCVKMDCHNPSSKNFKLIGVYKDHQTSDFLENMIGYSGDCVWNDDEYKFMSAMNSNNNNNNNNNNYNNNNNGVTYWPPKKCTKYKHQKDGSYVYYDALPSARGNLNVALYTDASCTTPYEGSDVTAEDAIGRDSKDIKSWNAAMDAFKICQPCVSYDTHTLSHTSKYSNHKKENTYNANGDRYGDNYAQQDDAAADDAAAEEEDDGTFVCRDNLENDDPINQCEAFIEGGKDTMSVATYRDILLAESQGTVTGIDLSPSSESKRGNMVMGESFVKPKHRWLSFLLFVLSIGYFAHALSRLHDKDRSKNGSMDEPLVAEESESSNSNNNNNKRKKQQRQQQRSNSSKSMVGTMAVVGAVTAASTSRKNKTKEQKAAEKKQKGAEKAQRKEQKKKSILKKEQTNYYDNNDDNYSNGSSHYSNYRL